MNHDDEVMIASFNWTTQSLTIMTQTMHWFDAMTHEACLSGLEIKSENKLKTSGGQNV